MIRTLLAIFSYFFPKNKEISISDPKKSAPLDPHGPCLWNLKFMPVCSTPQIETFFERKRFNFGSKLSLSKILVARLVDSKQALAKNSHLSIVCYQLPLCYTAIRPTHFTRDEGTKCQLYKDGSTLRYGTVRLNFCLEVRYAGPVRLFCNGKGTVRWYGTLFL